MKNKINLFWCKNERGYGNFGDELNHHLVKALTGVEPTFVDVMKLPENAYNLIKAILKNLLTGQFRQVFTKENFVSISNQKVVVAIGSVIGWYNSRNVIVWGAGILNLKTNVRNAEFRAVRGKYTLRRIEELGYNTNNVVLGDPALLLPLVLPQKRTQKNFKVGIIPHYMHYEEIKKNVQLSEVLIINLLDPVNQILDEMASCELILSTSLHGIIVGHAYGIPSLWVTFDNIKLTQLHGDDIKFMDYFSSLEISEYRSIPISMPINLHEIESIELKNSYVILPKKQFLEKVQRDLLKTAPFKIKDSYLNNIFFTTNAN